MTLKTLTGITKTVIQFKSMFQWSLVVVLSITGKFGEAQTNIPRDGISPIRIISMNPRVYKSHDTLYIYSGICKTLKVTTLTGEDALNLMTQSISYKTPSITIRGNVGYDFLYQSFSDTPYYQKNFRQHTLRTSLTVTVKNKYPLQVNMVIRKSNSPFFKDFLEGGVTFDRFSYENNIKQEMIKKIGKQIPGQSYLKEAENLLKKEIEKYNLLKSNLSAISISQKLIEEREKKYFQSRQSASVDLLQKKEINLDTVSRNISERLFRKEDELDTASFTENLTEQVDEKTKELDSVRQGIQSLQKQVDSMKNQIAGELSRAREKIYRTRNLKDLSGVLDEYGIDETKGNSQKLIDGLKRIGIGRTVINYSELTARNVLLTGLNVEYNPRLYTAVAAGKIDYGFRDFFGRNSRNLNQHLLMGRIGIGDIDKRAIIFSVFTGKKANYGSFISDTVKGNIPLTGISVETIVKKDRFTQFSAEIAKSTGPVTGRYADNKELGSLLHFSDNSNLGISLKAQTILPSTETKISGLFRKVGENFQSFSLFSYNTAQTSWMMKLNQPFFKDRLNFEGTLRRNDFVNPFTEKTFKTTTIFGSAQLMLRVPKWPSLTASYHPGSQLYIIDKNRVRENVYYMLNGTVMHQYHLFDLQMVSTAIYNNYTTKGTDSGFINYSGTTYMLSQAVTLQKFQLQGNFTYTDQQELRYNTWEGNLEYFITVFRVGAGLKYNRIINGKEYWGGTGQLMLDIKKLGTVQLQYEKSFLPTIQQTLFPVEIGSLTLLKNF